MKTYDQIMKGNGFKLSSGGRPPRDIVDKNREFGGGSMWPNWAVLIIGIFAGSILNYWLLDQPLWVAAMCWTFLVCFAFFNWQNRKP